MKRDATLWILLATILGSSMVFIDGNVVNVALPTLQRELNANASDVQWVIEAYSLFLAALIIVGGSLGDLFGRKRIFIIGTLIFSGASIWCGFAPSILQLIFARAIQGIGGALLTPGSLAIIRASIPEERRGQSIGLWSGFSAITSAIGPVLGGWLVQTATWRWVFFINVPMAIIVILVTLLGVPESRAEQAGSHHIDFAGALLATVGLGVLVFGLIESNSLGLTSPLVLACILLGLLILAGFILVEMRSSAPMMPLFLFRSKPFSGTNLLTFFLYAALAAAFFFFPFNLQSVQGYSPAAAGAALLPFTLILFALSRWAGGLVNRYGARLPLIVGPLLAGVGFILYAIPGIGGSYWTTFFPATIVLGIGMAITIAPLTTTVMNAVEDRYAGIASGINNAVSRVAGLLAIAVMSIVILQVFNVQLTNHVNALPIAPTTRQAIEAQHEKLVGIQIPTDVDAATHAQLRQAIDEAFISGFRVVMLISAGMAFASAFCTWLLIPGQPGKTPSSNTIRELEYDRKNKPHCSGS